MITAVIMICLGVLLLKGICSFIGFAFKAVFWLIIGISVALLLFASGLIMVGGMILVVACAGGLIALLID